MERKCGMGYVFMYYTTQTYFNTHTHTHTPQKHTETRDELSTTCDPNKAPFFFIIVKKIKVIGLSDY